MTNSALFGVIGWFVGMTSMLFILVGTYSDLEEKVVKTGIVKLSGEYYTITPLEIELGK